MSAVDLKSSDQAFIRDTRTVISGIFDSVTGFLASESDRQRLNRLRDYILPGKMLRTRLGMTLCPPDRDIRDLVVRACAATELIHTATLFHDDVIDGASMRRSHETLWKNVGQTGAILMGDLFFSSALQLLTDTGNMQRTASFVAKVREVCATEMIHEIIYRDRVVDTEMCMQVARGKTGPLFAFVSETCGGNDPRLTEIFEEVGYKIGTAYQLGDDLLDELGDEVIIGKTLGTDRKRAKFTLAQDCRITTESVRERINRLCAEALNMVVPYPEFATRLELYVISMILPTWETNLENVG